MGQILSLGMLRESPWYQHNGVVTKKIPVVKKCMTGKLGVKKWLGISFSFSSLNDGYALNYLI